MRGGESNQTGRQTEEPGGKDTQMHRCTDAQTSEARITMLEMHWRLCRVKWQFLDDSKRKLKA